MKSLRHSTFRFRARARLLTSLMLPVFALGASLAAHAAIPDLIFTEYVEGSSNNKAIEIYNGTGTAVDLSEYSVELYSNGSSSAGATLSTMTGTLASGDAYVIVNSSSGTELAALGDIISGVTSFNGDDALVLKHNGTVIDSFGQLGTDPGSLWGTEPNTTVNHTLRRKATICAGDTIPDDAFDPATEWDSYDIDNFDDLGSHTNNCNTPAIDLSINDVSQNEGDSGTSTFTFTVSLSAQAPAGGVTFDIATADGTATTADNDYATNSATGVTIPEGSSSYTFNVTVNGDTTVEQDETFFVDVTNVVGSGVTVADGQGQGTIANDDVSAVTISIDSVSEAEGDSGSKTFTFTVSLSEGAPTGGVSFHYATADDTAEAGTDYTEASGNGSIAEGASSTTVDVTVNGDTDVEDNETFKLNLTGITGTGVAPASLTTTGTIQNDDQAVVASITDASVTEGDSGTTSLDFTLTLDNPAPYGGVSFDVSTTDGTAEAGSDFDVPAASGSIAEGATSATISVPVHGDTDPETDETFTLNVNNISGANVSPTSLSATGTIKNDDIGSFAIYTIQGSPSTQGPDGASPYVDWRVRTSGVVTVAPGSGGFYLQDADGDGNPLTSDGVYVYAGSAGGGVSVGDKVSLEAKVQEYYGMTELSSVSNLVIESSGNPLPAPVLFDAGTPSRDPANLSCGDTNFECFEGMLVQVDDGTVTQPSGYSSAHTYDYVYVSAGGTRSLREPGLLYGLGGKPVDNPADNGAAGEWDGNPEVFEMSPNEFPGVNDDSVAITGGSRFTATGVIGYSFGSYEFYPSALQITEAAPVPRATPIADPSTLTIGSFNTRRFCDDVDDTVPGDTDPIPPGKELTECSGGSLPTTEQYEAKTQRLADYIGTVLNLPDVLALEEVENITVLGKLAERLKTDYGINYTPKLVEGNDIGGIDVGYLVNTDRVMLFPLAVQQLDKDLKWLTPNNHERPVFDHPPLLLQGIFTGGGQAQPFMVLANHLKARTDVDKVTSTGNSTAAAKEAQEKRFRQAYALAMQVQALQSGESLAAREFRSTITPASSTTTSIPLVVVGDFNAYEFTDGFADLIGMASGRYDFDANTWDLSDLTEWNLQPLATPLMDANVVSPALWNAVQSLPVNERYSYIFTPSFGAVQGYGIGGGAREVPANQTLDHALLDTGARAMFVRMDYGRANQDAASEDVHNSTGPIGVSDHDGFVVQLTTDRIFADDFENHD